MGLLSEYINKNWGANELQTELLRLIGEYNKLRKTDLLVYAAAMNKQVPDVSLSMDDYYVIFDLLRTNSSKKLDCYIQTPGGSGEAAEEVVRFTRSKFEDVSFVVSGEAKSAGTIIVLSGDEILMTHSGSLGPIDAQVKIGRMVVSAHDYLEWIREKRAEAEEKSKLNPFDATVVAQISPGELNGVLHALEFAKDLVVDWLPKYKFKNWVITETKKEKVTEVMKKTRAEYIAKKLSDHSKWRSHGRSIKIDDLEGIGLRITNVDKDAALSDIVYRIQTVIKLLFESTFIYKIFATANEKVFRIAAPSGVARSVPINQIQKPDVVQIEAKCTKCNTHYNLYAKLVSNPKIDEEFKKKGSLPFPNNNKLTCSCGFEIDLSGIRNNIETQVGKIV